jgi:hypothetical protein
MMISSQLRHGPSFFSRIIGVVSESHDFFLRHAAFHQVMFDQFADARTRPQTPATGYNVRRNTLTEEFRGTGCAIGVEIVVPQHHDRVRVWRGFVDDPRFRGEAHEGVPGKIKHHTQNYNEEEHHKVR